MGIDNRDEYKKIRHLNWLGSVWNITPENPLFLKFELDHYHPAQFPKEIAYRLISLYSGKGDLVLDPFCGSGTTNYVACSMGRETVGYDIEKKYIEIAKKRCKDKGRFICKSSKNMEEIQDNSVKVCITSPPYLNVRKYSGNPENIGNKENSIKALEEVFEETYRVMEKGGCLCVNVANVAKKGILGTFPFDLIYLCNRIGFRFRSSVIWDKGTTIKEWNIRNNEIAENHEYIWIFRK